MIEIGRFFFYFYILISRLNKRLARGTSLANSLAALGVGAKQITNVGRGKSSQSPTKSPIINRGPRVNDIGKSNKTITVSGKKIQSVKGKPSKVKAPGKASGAGGTNTNVVSTLPEDGNSTVGRWMSNDEYNKMIDTGKVQMSPNGNRNYVASPASKDAFPSAPNGSIYSEFDVAKNSLYPAGNENWSQIPGPGSLIDRLNQKKGLPAITEMPDALNIKNLGGK